MKQPELGNKIVELRNKKGLTQEELVEKCNINVRTLQRIESGEVNPRNFTIKVIFEALDYDINKESQDQKKQTTTYIKEKFYELNKQIKTTNVMKKFKDFLYDYFLGIGIIWFFCGIMILIFKITFLQKEVLLTLIIPLSFALFKQFTTKKTSQKENS